MRVITNNVPRDVIYAYELSADERAEFDYIDWDAVELGETSPEFFRYKGQLHDLSEFFTTSELHDDVLSTWDGYQSDSFFSGLVIRWPRGERSHWSGRDPEPDFEHVIVGLYLT